MSNGLPVQSAQIKTVDGILPAFQLRNSALSTLAPNPPYLVQMSLSQSHSMISCRSSHKSIKVYDAQSLGMLNELKIRHRSRITDFSFDFANDFALCHVAEEGLCNVWDVRTPRVVHEFRAQGERFHSVCSNGSLIAVGGTGHISFIDLRTGRIMNKLRDVHIEEITQLLFHPSSPTTLLSGSVDGIINVFDINVADPDDSLQTSINTEQSVRSLGLFGPQLNMLYCLTDDDSLFLYDMKEAESIGTFKKPMQNISQFSGMPTDYLVDCHYDPTTQSLLLLSGNHSGQLLISNVTQSSIEPCQVLSESHTADARCMAWGGQTLHTAGEDSRISVWSCDGNLNTEQKAIHSRAPGRMKARNEQAKFRPY
eukprot:176084_1